MLLLSGRNIYSDNSQCWVSPVGLDMVSNLMAQEKSDANAEVCLFYIFGHAATRNEPFTNVLAFFIHRLLCHNPRLLQNRKLFDEFNAGLSAFVRDKGAIEEGKVGHRSEKALEAMLVRVLDTFDEDQTIWLILDRVDKCLTMVEWNRHRRALLKVLSHAVERTTARLKVLAINKQSDWNIDNFMDELVEEDSESRTLLLSCNE